MTDAEPPALSTPSGGWRHRPRPVRAVRTEPEGLGQQRPAGAEAPPSPPEACPWLFLSTEPNARAAFVTDTHRCELRAEIAPGPGHQLAYCLSGNHISCPQLRAYEAQRQAGKPASPPGIEPPTLENGAFGPASKSDARAWLGRTRWIAAGAGGAVVLIAAIALLYAPPGDTTSVSPDAATVATATPTLQPAAPAPPLDAAPAQPDAEQPASPAPAAVAPALEPALEPTAEPTSEPAPEQASDGAGAAGEASTPEAASEKEPILLPYIVQPGDTLLIIAATYDVGIDELLEANDLGLNSTIYYGQKLLLPFGLQ